MPQNIGDNHIITDGIANITLKDAERLTRYRVRKGDIVYSRRGDVERRALIRENEDGWLCGTGCLRIRFNNDNIDPLFISYYLGHPSVRQWIVRHAIGATMPNLNTGILSALPLIIPPLPEQRTIAYILGTLDDKIQLNRQVNETLETTARAIFKSWFVDFDPVRAKMDGHHQPYGMDTETAALFPSYFENSTLEMIPTGWKVVKFIDAAEITYGYPFKSNYFNTKEGMPVIRIRDLSNHFSPTLTTEPYEVCFVIQSGDVLIGMDGEFRAYYWQGEPSLLNQRLCRVRPLLSVFPQSYLYFAIQSPLAFFESSQVGTTVIHLGKKELDTIDIIYPSPEILTKFGQITMPMFEKIVVNSNESRTLSAIKDTLLPKLLSGEIRVREAEKYVQTHL